MALLFENFTFLVRNFILKKHSKGLTAYRLLSELQKTRNVKPMTVYRSLNNLQKMGVVHKSNQSKTLKIDKHQGKHY